MGRSRGRAARRNAIWHRLPQTQPGMRAAGRGESCPAQRDQATSTANRPDPPLHLQLPHKSIYISINVCPSSAPRRGLPYHPFKSPRRAVLPDPLSPTGPVTRRPEDLGDAAWHLVAALLPQAAKITVTAPPPCPSPYPPQLSTPHFAPFPTPTPVASPRERASGAASRITRQAGASTSRRHWSKTREESWASSGQEEQVQPRGRSHRRPTWRS
jgi:hypothetical protein